MSTSSKRPAGSPTAAGEPAFLAVGRLRRSHGLAGEALVEILTDFPERLRPKTTIYMGERHEPLTIRGGRPIKDGLLLTFEGITTPEQVSRYRSQILYVPNTDRPHLPEGEYYHHQLLGLAVIDESGQELGDLTEILETGANDVYVVTSAGGEEILLPVISGVVLDIDLSRRTMRVHLPAGLVEEE